MKLSRKIISIFMAAVVGTAMLPAAIETSAAKSFAKSDFVETEQPELSDETKKLISLYQKDPSEENYLKLRDIVIENYNAVLDRKEAKLAELKAETAGKPGGEEKVAEMEEIVQEMYITYWNRINSSMLRFTDTRLLKWKISNASKYDYIPVMGAGESIYVKRTPVTNKDYSVFLEETGNAAPSNWTNGKYHDGEDDLPVNFVSYEDAKSYCEWLTERDGKNTYRLPNESEWELAAGHMPKDADFNCGINDGRTPVEQYGKVTRGAHGAIDFWGNVWEWTSTVRSKNGNVTTLGVKGGSWSSERTQCRTEYRKEGRNSAVGYDDVGFRVIQVRGGKEPAQKVELATLDYPTVSAKSASDKITLSWKPVKGAVEYQLFEYFESTGLLKMLDTVKGTSVTIKVSEPNSTHSYIVQPISYVEVADNVSPENCIRVTCGENVSVSTGVSSMKKITVNGLNCLLYTPKNATENMPLIVYLHGIKGKGDDPNKLLTSDEFVQWFSDGTMGDVPAYVLMPQLPSDKKDWIAIKKTVVSAIKETAEKYKVDSENISLTGFSMGGAGVWDIAASYPQMFRCIAPCSGGLRADKTKLNALCNMKVWAFVGMEDTVVKPQRTVEFMEQLAKINSDAVITKFDDAEHTDVPELAYLGNENELIYWLTEK